MPIDEIEISANQIEKKPFSIQNNIKSNRKTPFSIQNNIKSNIYVCLYCFVARTDKVIVNWFKMIIRVDKPIDILLKPLN